MVLRLSVPIRLILLPPFVAEEPLPSAQLLLALAFRSSFPLSRFLRAHCGRFPRGLPCPFGSFLRCHRFKRSLAANFASLGSVLPEELQDLLGQDRFLGHLSSS